MEIQQRSFTQSEPVCTESLTSLAGRNVTCLQTHLSSKNTACKSVGQAISISRLSWGNLFGIYINIVPECLSCRSGSFCARFCIHTKKERSSIQKAYNLNIRQGSKCVQTTRQASGSNITTAGMKIPKICCASGSAQETLPIGSKQLTPYNTDISVLYLLELFVSFGTITSKLLHQYGLTLNLS